MPIFHETFDGVTAPSLPSGLTFAAGLVTTASPGGSIVPTSSPNVLALNAPGNNTHYFAAYNTADSVSGNVTVQCNFNAVATSANQTFGLFSRASATSISTTSGTYYWLQLSPNGLIFRLYKVIAGVQTALSSITLSTLPEPTWYQPTLYCYDTPAGTLITGAVQRLSDGYWLTNTGTFQAGSAAAISLYDSSSPITGSGFAGLTIQSRSDDAYADDWIFDQAAAPVPIVRMPSALLEPEVSPPRVVRPELPSPGTPTPTPTATPPPPPTSQSATLLSLLNFFGEPGPDVVVPPSIPEHGFPGPARPGLVVPVIQRPGLIEELAPWVTLRPSLPSVGTPTPIVAAPPGSFRVVTGSIEDAASHASLPCALPSIGTATPDIIPPPGQPRSAIYSVEEYPAHASLPCALPSVGIPGSTGSGLVVPPWRIAASWTDDESHESGVGFAGLERAGTKISPLPQPGSAYGGTAAFNLGSLGCCCCETKICVAECASGSSSPVVGATVTVKSAGVEIYSGTTGSNGCVSTSLVNGIYLVEIAIGGETVWSKNYMVTDCSTIGIQVNCCWLLCLDGCSIEGASFEGAVMTVKDSHGATVGTCNTDYSGCCWINGPPGMPDPDGYTLTCTFGGQTASVASVGCGGEYTFGWQCVQVLGCFVGAYPVGHYVPIVGATVILTPFVGSALTGTTDSNGYACFLVANLYDWTVTSVSGAPRFQDYPAGGTLLGGPGCASVYLAVADGYICCVECDTPVCKTLSLTDSVLGTATLTWDGTGWYGTLTGSYSAGCGCPGGDVEVAYSFSCGDWLAPTFTLNIAISCCVPLEAYCPCIDGTPPDPQSLCPGGTLEGGAVGVGHASFSSKACGPLEVTFDGAMGCDCYELCQPFGTIYPCGCGPSPTRLSTALLAWGGAGTAVTWTIVESCA